MNAVSELSFSRLVSETADPPVHDIAPSNPPENTSNVAGNLNHHEMLHSRSVVSGIPPGSTAAITQLSKG